MSTHAYLYVDKTEIFSWRNDLDYAILNLFSRNDLTSASGEQAIRLVKDLGLSSYAGHEEDGDDFHITLFIRPAGDLQDRLNVLGYGEEAFVKYIDDLTALYKEIYSDPVTSKTSSEETMAEANSKFVANYKAGKPLSKKDLELLNDALEGSSCFALYFQIKDIARDKKVILDISEFEYEGWYDDSLLELGKVSEEVQRLSSAPIILTEGAFDRRVLKATIELLYPHLSSYVRFLDSDYKTEGGAGAVVKTIKSFAAAGISNRILAIFDNDSAVEEALTSLAISSLPANYKIMRYPEIEYAKTYPTIGPQGKILMDINGLAGSIELYLGRDVLIDETGELRPVQWTGYLSKIRKYQGEVLSKAKIQASFLEKIKVAKSQPSSIASQDWTGLKRIIDSIISELGTV